MRGTGKLRAFLRKPTLCRLCHFFWFFLFIVSRPSACRWTGNMNMKLQFPLICLIILLLVCSLFAADKEALQKELKEHKARSESTWRQFAGREIKNRIVPAPNIVLDYLMKDNQVQGYKEIPKRPEIDPELLSDIVNAVTEMPKPVRDHIKKHVVAIFLVEELYLVT